MAWLFAYGSLMWDENRNIAYEGVEEAELQGYHRDLNKKSTRNWGTSENPAPVLGLEEGGMCEGKAFKLPRDNWESILNELNDREGPSYSLENLTAIIEGEEQETYVFVNQRNHTYIGELPIQKRAEMSLEAKGKNGSGIEYVVKTWAHLDRIGIEDQGLDKYLREMVNVGLE